MRWEFSLCRVYVISGSFRAFDRRPLEKEGAESRVHRIENNFGGARAHQTCPHSQMLEAGESSITKWDVNNNNNNNNGFQLQEPVWELEWEHFNWL